MEGFGKMIDEKMGEESESYPVSFGADVEQIPEIEKWELGKSYPFEFRMVSRTESVEEDNKTRAHFELVKIGSKKVTVPTKNEDKEEEPTDDGSYESDD